MMGPVPMELGEDNSTPSPDPFHVTFVLPIILPCRSDGKRVDDGLWYTFSCHYWNSPMYYWDRAQRTGHRDMASLHHIWIANRCVCLLSRHFLN